MKTNKNKTIDSIKNKPPTNTNSDNIQNSKYLTIFTVIITLIAVFSITINTTINIKKIQEKYSNKNNITEIKKRLEQTKFELENVKNNIPSTYLNFTTATTSTSTIVNSIIERIKQYSTNTATTTTTTIDIINTHKTNN